MIDDIMLEDTMIEDSEVDNLMINNFTAKNKNAGGSTYYTQQIDYGSRASWDYTKADPSLLDPDTHLPLYPVESERDDYEFDSWSPNPATTEIKSDQIFTATFNYTGDKFLKFLRTPYAYADRNLVSITDTKFQTALDSNNSRLSILKGECTGYSGAKEYIMPNFRGVDYDNTCPKNWCGYGIINPCGGYLVTYTGDTSNTEYFGNITTKIEIDIPNFQCTQLYGDYSYPSAIINVNRLMNRQDETTPGVSNYAGEVLDLLSYDANHQAKRVDVLTVNPQCERLIAYNNELYGCLYTGVGPREVFMPYLEKDCKTVYKNTWNNYRRPSPEYYSYAFPNTIELWWAGNLDQISEHYLLRRLNDSGEKVNHLVDLILTRSDNICQYNITEANADYDLPYDCTVWVPSSKLAAYQSDTKWKRVTDLGVQIKAFDSSSTPERILNLCKEVEAMKFRQAAYRAIDSYGASVGWTRGNEDYTKDIIYHKREWLRWCADYNATTQTWSDAQKPSWVDTAVAAGYAVGLVDPEDPEHPYKNRYAYKDFYWKEMYRQEGIVAHVVDPPEIHRYYTMTLNEADGKKIIEQTRIGAKDNNGETPKRLKTDYATNLPLEFTFTKPPTLFKNELSITTHNVKFNFPNDISSWVATTKGSNPVFDSNKNFILTLNFCNENSLKWFCENYMFTYITNDSKYSFAINNNTITSIDLSSGFYVGCGASVDISNVTFPTDWSDSTKTIDLPRGTLATANITYDPPAAAIKSCDGYAFLNTPQQDWTSKGEVTIKLHKDFTGAYPNFYCKGTVRLKYLGSTCYNNSISLKVEGTLIYDNIFYSSSLWSCNAIGKMKIENITSDVTFNTLNADGITEIDVCNENMFYSTSEFDKLYFNDPIGKPQRTLYVNGVKYTDVNIPNTVSVPASTYSGNAYGRFYNTSIEKIVSWGNVKRLGTFNFCNTNLKGILNIPGDVYGNNYPADDLHNFDNCPYLDGIKFADDKTVCEAGSTIYSKGWKLYRMSNTRDFVIDIPNKVTNIGTKFIEVGTAGGLKPSGKLSIICRRGDSTTTGLITVLDDVYSIFIGNNGTGTESERDISSYLAIYVPPAAKAAYIEAWQKFGETTVSKSSIPTNCFHDLEEYVPPFGYGQDNEPLPGYEYLLNGKTLDKD